MPRRPQRSLNSLERVADAGAARPVGGRGQAAASARSGSCDGELPGEPGQARRRTRTPRPAAHAPRRAAGAGRRARTPPSTPRRRRSARRGDGRSVRGDGPASTGSPPVRWARRKLARRSRRRHAGGADGADSAGGGGTTVSARHQAPAAAPAPRACTLRSRARRSIARSLAGAPIGRRASSSPSPRRSSPRTRLRRRHRSPPAAPVADVSVRRSPSSTAGGRRGCSGRLGVGHVDEAAEHLGEDGVEHGELGAIADQRDPGAPVQLVGRCAARRASAAANRPLRSG